MIVTGHVIWCLLCNNSMIFVRAILNFSDIRSTNDLNTKVVLLFWNWTLVNESIIMKDKKYHIVRKIPKSNIKIEERATIDHSNTQIHDCSLSWLGTGTSITSGGIKLVLWVQTPPLSEMIRSCKCLLHVNIYNQIYSL